MFAHLLVAKSDHHINDGKAAFLLCVWHSQVPRYLVHIHHWKVSKSRNYERDGLPRLHQNGDISVPPSKVFDISTTRALVQTGVRLELRVYVRDAVLRNRVNRGCIDEGREDGVETWKFSVESRFQ